MTAYSEYIYVFTYSSLRLEIWMQFVFLNLIRLNFEDAYMEGPGFARHSPCETDMIFIRGFKYWQPPAWCGNLTGYVGMYKIIVFAYAYP